MTDHQRGVEAAMDAFLSGRHASVAAPLRPQLEAAIAAYLATTEPGKPESGVLAGIGDLIDRYWQLAYAEGRENRQHDTEAGDAQECRRQIDDAIAALRAEPCDPDRGFMPKFALRDRVSKKSGSSWNGHVVGFYSTELTPNGYCVESEREPGSVQIYPEAALTAALRAEPCEPVAWMFEGKGWGREVMLSEQEALERKERLSRTWDITITPLYSSPAPSLGVDIEALQRRVEELEAALEFYADELTWADTNPKDDGRITVLVPSPSFAEIDRGKVAREVLQEQKKDG